MSSQNRVLARGTAILSVSLDAAQFIAQFAPVPALAPTLSIVARIIDACEKIQSNKKEVRQLQERCRYLILALYDEINLNEIEDQRVAYLVEGCIAHLEKVLTVVSGYARYSLGKSWIHLGEISDGIKSSHVRIDDCCREFQIRSHLRLHQWKNDFGIAREEDRKELLTRLTNLEEGSLKTQQMIGEVGQLLQKYLGESEQDSPQYHAMASNLYMIQNRFGELPPGTDLKAKEAQPIGKFPVGGSAAFDIWEGTWLGQEKVALKFLRGVPVSPKTRKRFQQEVEIWREVWKVDRGRYILPFYGVCFENVSHPYTVSPWMTCGNVMEYLSMYPTAGRRDMIKGIANGLSFLHNLKPKTVVHGNIRGANVLINDGGRPLLADFGLSKILENVTGVPFTQSTGVTDSYRWFAPELYAEPGVLSTYSDVFAYAMTVVEIITGNPPFDHIKGNAEVLIKMQTRGERPRKPTNPEIVSRGLDDSLWNLLTQCWTVVPEERPSIDDVLKYL